MSSEERSADSELSAGSETAGEGPDVASGPESEQADSDPVLRAKYADFCSAQLTEVFLSLSDERIYEIVQEEARAQDVTAAAIGFRAMVRLATKRLRESVPLPDFETWKRDYEADPERYDRYLLGLWRQLTVGDADDDG